MKNSIKKQIVMVFAGLIAVMMILLIVMNAWLLEPYYVKDKQQKIHHLYEAIYNTVDEGILPEEEGGNYKDLVYIAEKNNLFFLIVNMTKQSVCTNVQNEKELKQRLDEYLLNRTAGEEKVLEATEDYELSRSKCGDGQTEYLMMRGSLPEGNFFLIQSPIESMTESAALSNRFLIAIGVLIVLVGAFCVWEFSKRLTNPILELAVISQKMANLDFDAKYTGGGENEIGILGKNFNTMSGKLEQAISELKSVNCQLQKDIEKKDQLEEMRNQFLGNVSHELKTPIALIQGYAEGLKDGVSSDEESRQYYCDVIIDEAAKMNQMVKSLLTLNQLEFGDEDLVFSRFDVVELIKGVLSSMSIMADQEEINVCFYKNHPVYVWADELKVEQVLRNYISNAFHHAMGEKEVEIAIEEKDDKVRIFVRNTGKPIPDEDLPHIWEKFYKVDKAHTRSYGGNGIGLSIVSVIMEAFHNDYGVQNLEGKVEFWFELDRK